MLPLVVAATTVAYWYQAIAPGATSRWILLSFCLPLLCLFGLGRWKLETTLFAAWLCYGALSLLWSPAVWPGINALWQFTLIGAAIYLGAGIKDTQPVFLAFATGMAVNGLIALAQLYGADWFLQASVPAGTFGNKNLLAEAGLLALIACVLCRHWWRWVCIPGCLLAWWLPGSLGAYGAMALVVVIWLWLSLRTHYPNWIANLCLLLLPVMVFGTGYLLSTNVRFVYWQDVFWGMKLFGHGLGSFWAIYPSIASGPTAAGYTYLTQPATAHNDVLTILSDTGIGSVFLLLFALSVGWRVINNNDRVGYILLAFLGLGVFNFPFYEPTTALFAALCTGLVCRGRVSVWRDGLGLNHSVYRRFAKYRAV